ncbi:MAG: DUF1292 domain-containing protein [Lachnospiraceae bacterium]|nr:DUF1292 domain-containing protein [Lachnospiraceae bacterium]
MEKITFTADDGETAEFFVLEQTTVGGINYILVTDSEEGDGEALILKDMSAPDAEDADYEIVSDDEELKSISGVFENLLEDIKFS